jgi:hypothetical protein
MRGRELPISLASEECRMAIRDMRDYLVTGFNPFDEASIKRKAFWKSRKEYQKVSFPAWLAGVVNLATMVRSQMTKVETDKAKKEALAAQSKRSTNSENEAKTKKKPNQNLESLGAMVGKLSISEKPARLSDTIVASYPRNDKLLIMFELHGDIKRDDANTFDFTSPRTIVQWSRLPKVWINATSLIGKPGSNTEDDADIMLLDVAIKQRMTGVIKKDEDGHIWEPREVVALPFPCKQQLYNKYGEELDTYLIHETKFGYKWGYFWLLREEFEPAIPSGTTMFGGGLDSSDIEVADESSDESSDESDINMDDCEESDDEDDYDDDVNVEDMYDDFTRRARRMS